MTASIPFHITIARQLGSGGSELGQRIACRLGFAYMNHLILEQAADELEMNESDLAHREEKIQSIWERIMPPFTIGCPEQMMFSPQLLTVSDERLIEAEKRVLLRLASMGSCVIVGRCGFHLLADNAVLFNIFVHASKRFRIERVRKYYNAKDLESAEEMIESSDHNRERYVKRISGRSWYDARNYHLSIDMSQVGFDESEEMIASLLKKYL